GVSRSRGRRPAVRGAPSRPGALDEDILEVLPCPPAGAAVDVPAEPRLEPEARAREDLRVEIAPVVDDDEHRRVGTQSGRGPLEDRCDAGAVGLEGSEGGPGRGGAGLTVPELGQVRDLR